MWSIKDLKTKGLAAFKRNYWSCVLVALVLAFVSGGGGGGGGGSSSSSSSSSSSMTNIFEQFEDNDSYDYDDFDDYDDYDGFDDFDDFEFNEYDNEDYDGFTELSAVTSKAPVKNSSEILITTIIVLIVLVIVLLVVAISAAVGILVFAPLKVGCHKFFVENSAEPVKPGLMGFGFKKGNWKNIVLTMFTTNLFIGLWTLLFIIPGIIKSYEWLMVPYILADDPTVNHKQAREISSRMMYGHKWHAFCLNLSFIGWNILSIFTCGILSIFFVNPYLDATNAELYIWMRSNNNPGGYSFVPAKPSIAGYDASYTGYSVNNAYPNVDYNSNTGYSNGYNPAENTAYNNSDSNNQYNNYQGYNNDYQYNNNNQYNTDNQYNYDNQYNTNNQNNDSQNNNQ